MICYRIEDNLGIGFNLSLKYEDIPKTIIRRHKLMHTPFEDRLNLFKDDKEWFCAFKSIDELDKWITMDELDQLINLGFNLYKLEVSEYQIGNHQLIYTKESIINKKNITNELLTI